MFFIDAIDPISLDFRVLLPMIKVGKYLQVFVAG